MLWSAFYTSVKLLRQKKKFPKVRDVFLSYSNSFLGQTWNRYGIRMKSIKDWVEFQLSKIPQSRRRTKNAVLRINQIQDSLNVLCDFSPSNVFELLRSSRTPHWFEDYVFFWANKNFLRLVPWAASIVRMPKG